MNGSLSQLPIPKLMELGEAVTLRKNLANARKRVVLTNGCYDLLHAGHLYSLQEARRAGDALFVAINSDESVRALKGPKRPVQTERERAYALGALECVTAVIIFRQPRLVREIEALQPDVYAKAGDYTLETLDPTERAALQSAGADIRFMPYLEGFSSTDLIRRISAAGGTA